MESPRIQRALISLSDKLGLGDFARGLVAAGVELYSTGGTRRFLEEEQIPVHDVASYTGFPEIMSGRVKTLHPKIHGGILWRHDHQEDRDALAEHGILSFELVVVNLYPFVATVARPDVTFEEAIEQIDIGGPSMIRAAAKNHRFVTIVTEPEQYGLVLREVAEQNGTTEQTRRMLASAAFEHTAQYDRAIADFMSQRTAQEAFSENLNLSLRRKATLRYGENPHQQAALYCEARSAGANLTTARQLSGKELSFNNYLDLDAALAMVRGLGDKSAVVIKHTNPCGAASADTLVAATKAAFEGDPVSAFGSVLGFNQKVDVATAEFLAEPGLFVEVIIAPDYDAEALEILTTRPKWKSNVRLMATGSLDEAQSPWDYRRIDGGLLVQERDILANEESSWKVVTKKHPSDAELGDLRLSWTLVRHVKSNAIVLAKQGSLLGVGAGQMSRVDSVNIAIEKAGARAAGAVLASDAFFPFADSIEQAADAGITAVIQPGGSRRDDEVIAACDQRGLSMVFTGRRHFKH
jgi:phosphoribosylaminoimidazolecarboxamide formyltransferase/IMP cyclohydrolase